MAPPPHVFVLSEEPKSRYQPFFDEIERVGGCASLINLSRVVVDISEPPPPGVYWCRLSGSASFRRNESAARVATALCEIIRYHAERAPHDYALVNLAALKFEDCKVTQLLHLRRFGFRVPESVLVVGQISMASALSKSAGLTADSKVVVKPVRGGSSRDVHVVGRAAHGPSGEAGAVRLCQQYVGGDDDDDDDASVYRFEVVGPRCIYVLQTDSERLARLGHSPCPCAASGGDAAEAARDGLMRVLTRQHWTPPIAETARRCETLVAELGIDVAAIEFARMRGEFYPIDMNCNVNYRRRSEVAADVASGGVQQCVRLLLSKSNLGATEAPPTNAWSDCRQTKLIRW